eukprot:CAMPEP_0197698774 /NCGR_PEP_ID=MMETSP1338-20131121/119724_1 /TAXON_ID=43686 ORGANISM="Pelagodinium beii, Strain RCC1491" /NCGR_SAMPLE_ID=MMETSP1338 /ASSEMBLY_ACC=CAM_ASM_000754 /LENGTH=76 /DNA_ID=CAMNT_0043282193 /DNA_START=12 /DNA_END=238 /DNA_ORIENTATION=-
MTRCMGYCKNRANGEFIELGDGFNVWQNWKCKAHLEEIQGALRPPGFDPRNDNPPGGSWASLSSELSSECGSECFA